MTLRKEAEYDPLSGASSSVVALIENIDSGAAGQSP